MGRAESLMEDASVRHNLDVRDRALAMELFYGVVRNLTSLDYVISRYAVAPQKGIAPRIKDILRLAVYQMTRLDRVPARAAVYEAVEQAKGEGMGASRFVNGVLRTILREPDRAAIPPDDLGLLYSFPGWLVKRWVARYGFDEAGSLMRASNSVPPLTLRANTLKTSRDALCTLLTDAGLKATPAIYSPDGLAIEGSPPVRGLPGYTDGLFAVQDEAAQLVSLLLNPRPGGLILDACAAPGGKTSHIQAISNGGAHVVAMDIGLDKLGLLKENITRLKTGGVYMLQADASGPMPLKGGFDGIMLDAPCSATGVIRRRPEIKYNRREADIQRLSRLQGRMLRNVAGLIKPGGALVYAVCSTEPEEGELVVESFIKSGKGFIVDDPGPLLPVAAKKLVTGGGFVRTYPHRHGMDGFFAARMVKV